MQLQALQSSSKNMSSHLCSFLSLLSFHDFGLVNAKMCCALHGKPQSFMQCVDEQTSHWIGSIMQDEHTPFMERSLQNKDWFTSTSPGEMQIHPECELMSASPETIDSVFKTFWGGIVSSSPSHSPQGTLFEEEWQCSCQKMMPWFMCCNDLVIDESSHGLFPKRHAISHRTADCTSFHKKEEKGTCVSLPVIDKH